MEENAIRMLQCIELDAEKSQTISADEWMPLIQEYLKERKQYKISPSGSSMCPFIVGGRDEVVLSSLPTRLKKGDVVWYRRENGIHVLHRIYRIQNQEYYMVGDNQTEVEGPLCQNQILGFVTQIYRKNKVINCDSYWYRLVTLLWLWLRPFRPIVLYVIQRIIKVKKKLKSFVSQSN